MLKGVLTKLGLATPEIDPLGGDPAVHAARRALLAGDAKPLAALLDPKRSPDERALALRVFEKMDPRPPALDAWLRAEPRSPLALLARGAHGISWAWFARGGGYANTVTAEGRRLFVARLAAARQDLVRAAELDPRDPEPHAHLMTVALGQDQDLDEIRVPFEAAIARAPEHHEVHHDFLQASSAKWHGSDQAALELARGVSARARPGSALHDLVPAAHIEVWLQIWSGDEPSGHRGYWTRPEVLKDLSAAWSRAGGHFEGVFAGDARNLFAFAFFMARDSRAGGLFEKIARRPTQRPWRYFGEPGKAFLEAEKGVLFG